MKFLNDYFKLEQKGTTVRTEIRAGITTFLAMAYILFVNPNTLQALVPDGSGGMMSLTEMSWGAVFTATAIAAIVGTLIMGLYAKYPVAQAPGMGMNAFFTWTIVVALGYTWQQALAMVFVSGTIFLIISVTGLRKMIINAIPKELKYAVGAGIGLFIAFIGFMNAGIVKIDTGIALPQLGNLTEPIILLSVIGLIITAILYIRKIRGAIFIGIIATSIIGFFMGLTPTPDGIVGIPEKPYFLEIFTGFKTLEIGVQLFMVIFVLLFIDFFDTAGTLMAVGTKAGLLNDKGELEGADRALISDATATVVGAAVGTSSTTSYIESMAGIEEGGRTGLTSVVTAFFFLVFMFFSPLLSVVTAAATAPALIFVGILMASQLKEIDWDDIVIAIPAFLTIILMPLTYSIAEGIAAGFVLYPISMFVAGRGKKVHPIMYVLMVIFIGYFWISPLLA